MSEFKQANPYIDVTHDDLIEAFPYWSNAEMRQEFPDAKCIGDIALKLIMKESNKIPARVGGEN